MHERVQTLVLVNGSRRGEPTQSNILDALGMLRKATENDTVVMFVSGHGLFTLPLVEGVKGAAKNGAGEVRTEGLRDYLRLRVGELAKAMKRQQTPQYYRGRDAGNYLLAHGE